MQEAIHSFNIKFRMQGFECQFTVRDDNEKGTGQIVAQGQAVVRMLAGLTGVSPTNGNGKPAGPAGPAGPAEQVCPTCGKSDQLELITTRAGKKVYKCQRCKKWLPDPK